jgi:uncharacterized membrane protein
MPKEDLLERFKFFINRVEEKLWVKPLIIGLLSVAAIFLVKLADYADLGSIVPEISAETIDTLLSIMASSMLVIATFSVASMVGAYSSASKTASPRSFRLVVADDLSQRALSTFIGAFIFSIVGIIAIKNNFFNATSRFILFILIILVFALVIYMFVRWVDRIARLGRMGNTISKVESATIEAIKDYKKAPLMGGKERSKEDNGQPVYSDKTGYVQTIEMAELQACAESIDKDIRINALPGSFVTPEKVLAYIQTEKDEKIDLECKHVVDAFLVGKERVYDDDPRFGFVVLSQIADKALSPAVNDPGTAIDIIGIMVRLFDLWASPNDNKNPREVEHDRVEVPELPVTELFDDAFTAIERDGSSSIEVMARLQKALASVAAFNNNKLKKNAIHHSERALKYAEENLLLEEDKKYVREIAEKIKKED